MDFEVLELEPPDSRRDVKESLPLEVVLGGAALGAAATPVDMGIKEGSRGPRGQVEAAYGRREG